MATETISSETGEEMKGPVGRSGEGTAGKISSISLEEEDLKVGKKGEGK